MKRTMCVFAFGLIFLAVTTAASAQSSDPIIQGGVQGIELCPKFICGRAYFTGIFQGRIGGNPSALGIINTALDHDDLPTEIGVSANITGGDWELRTLTRRI